MNIILVDINHDLIEQWKFYFDEFPNITIIETDIIPITEKYNDAHIVSPANSFGDLQGGIDLVYYKHFGYELEEKLEQVIIKEKYGELIVGDALLLERFIFAPTMRIPMNISHTVNVYLSFRAVLICAIKNNLPTIICPGLGTGIGKVHPEVCAKQMYKAYIEITQPRRHFDLQQMSIEHQEMININDPNI